MNEPGKNVTVVDLANEAGVSPATISRVLNHSYLVSQSTYNRVLAAIDRLGYEIPDRKKPAVQKKSDTSIIAVNISNFTDRSYGEYLRGIQTCAYRYEWAPVIIQNPLTEHSVDACIKAVLKMDAEGLIILNYVPKNVLSILENELAIVQCGEYNSDSSIPYVGIDDYNAAYEASKYLIKSGARKILYAGAPLTYHYARERRRGYEKALKDAGIELNPSNSLELSEANYSMAHASISPLLSLPNYPDAIFAANDTIAYAAVIAAREQGLRIPEDVSIIGFDNQEISMMSMPKITTISQPRFKMGFIACELLHERLVDQNSKDQKIILSTEFIFRESTR